MGARHAVLLTPSKSSGPPQLLSYKQLVSVTSLESTLVEVFILKNFKRDYVLDTKEAPCYAFFVRFFALAATFLMCLTTFGWNRCFINSSLVMWRGCFFFFMVTR
jgi:hypothetical protein